jgi:hypothetical protein
MEKLKLLFSGERSLARPPRWRAFQRLGSSTGAYPMARPSTSFRWLDVVLTGLRSSFLRASVASRCAGLALLTIISACGLAAAGEHPRRVYELSQQDFTTARPLSSLNVSVFDIMLGMRRDESLRLARSVGRPVAEWASSRGWAFKAVHVFYSHDEFRNGKSMAIFESADGETVTQITLIGIVTGGAKGFEQLAVGGTRRLLAACDSERTGVLGREDYETTVDRDKFWAKDYTYQREGISLMYAVDTHHVDPTRTCHLVFSRAVIVP